MATISKLANPSFVASSSIRSDRIVPNRYVPVRSVAAPVRLSIRSNQQRRCFVYDLVFPLSLSLSVLLLTNSFLFKDMKKRTVSFLHVFSWGVDCLNKINVIKSYQYLLNSCTYCDFKVYFDSLQCINAKRFTFKLVLYFGTSLGV